MKQKYFLVQGGTLQCQYGSTTDTLRVKTHAILCANDRGNDKLVGTTLETGTSTLQNNSFGSCTKLGSPPPPCKVNITEWKYFYSKVGVYTGGKVLLECSSAVCAIAGTPCISVVNHGQEISLCKTHFSTTDTEAINRLNPLADSEKMSKDTDEVNLLKKLIQAE